MPRTHGQDGTLTHNSWSAMMQRCRDPRHGMYPRYGGRGIRVCERWLKFETFLADMGERPSKAHSIDRIDPNGNYEPGNVRWATHREQRQNRPDNVMVEYRGERMCIAELARRVGMRDGLLRKRLKKLDVETAVSAPVIHHSGPRRW